MPSDEMVEKVINAISGCKDIMGTPLGHVRSISEMREIARAALAAAEAGEPVALTLSALQAAHVARQEEWCPDQKPDLSFRGNEMAGEVGEACNVIKKLERERHGWRGSRATKEQLAEELADVIHTACLCAITAGVDIEAATVAKFNSTSEKNGLASRLACPPSEAVRDERAAIRKEAFEEAAAIGYRICAETRHVTLGDKVEAAIRARGAPTGAGADQAGRG